MSQAYIKASIRWLWSHKTLGHVFPKENCCSLGQLKPMLPWAHGWPWNFPKSPKKKGCKLPHGATTSPEERMCLNFCVVIIFFIKIENSDWSSLNYKFVAFFETFPMIDCKPTWDGYGCKIIWNICFPKQLGSSPKESSLFIWDIVVVFHGEILLLLVKVAFRGNSFPM